MPRILAILAVLLPAFALAQVTVTETSDFENGDDEIINIVECKGTVRSNFSVSWTVAASTATTAQVDLRISDTVNCPFPTQNTNTNAKTSSLGVFTGLSGSLSTPRAAADFLPPGITCEDGVLRSINVCAVITTAGTDAATGTQSAVIQLDGKTPTPPANVRVTPGDSALDVTWDAASSANRYRVEATPQAGGETVRSSETTDTSRRISRLVNGTTYDVGVVALSIGGNPSALSAVVAGTPVEVDDFWRRYQGSPGAHEQGGCSTGGSGTLALSSLLGLLPLVLRRRRS
jgi:Fibronectin type III domain